MSEMTMDKTTEPAVRSKKRAAMAAVRLLLSDGQAHCLEAATRAMAEHEPMMLIVGGAGSGKTLIARRLASRSRHALVLAADTLVRETLLDELARLVLPDAAASDDLDLVMKALTARGRNGRPSRRIIIDHAHLLSEDVLELILRMAALQQPKAARVCFTLVGATALQQRVERFAGSGSGSGKPCRVLRLERFTPDDTRAIMVAGMRRGRERQVSQAAVLALHLLARGNPARVAALTRAALMRSADGCSITIPDLLMASLRIPGSALPDQLVRRLRALAALAGRAGRAGAGQTRELGWVGGAAAIVLGVILGHYAGPMLVHEVRAADMSAAPTASVPDTRPAPPAVPSFITQPVAEHGVIAAPASGKSVTTPVSAVAAKRAARLRAAAARKALAKAAARGVAAPAAVTAQATVAAQAEAKADVRADVRAEVRADTKADSKQEPKQEPKPEARAEARPDAKVEKHRRGGNDDLVRAGDAIALGRNSEAVTLLRKVLAADPSNHEARTSLLAILAERGKDDDWLEAMSAAARFDPQRFAFGAIQGLLEQNRLEEARSLLQSIPVAHRDARLLGLSGVLFTRMQQYQQALRSYDEALVLTASDTSKYRSLVLARAVVLEHLDRIEEARSAYRSTIEGDASPAALAFARARLANLQGER